MAARNWQRLFDKIVRFIAQPKPARIDPPGSSRSVALSGLDGMGEATTRTAREWDEESQDRYVRSPQYGAACTDMVRNCPEAASAIATIVQAALFGIQGDSVGFVASSPDREVDDVIQRAIKECIGGMRLERALYELMEGGNSFAVPLLEYASTSTGYRLTGIAYRPPWEMFRLEDNNGRIIGYEQRRYRSEAAPVEYHPMACFHWRYRTQKLYGRSLFHESLDDWADLQQVQSDLVRASRAVGLNPTVHTMPAGRGAVYRQKYADAFMEEQSKYGAVAHLFIDNGIQISKANNSDPDLKALQSTFEMLQRRVILKSHVPPYMFGLETGKANNLSGAPNEQFIRFIKHIQSCLSEGIRFFIDLDLALHGIPRERWDYVVSFPSLSQVEAEASL